MDNFAMLISIVKSAIEKTAHLLNLQNYLNDAGGQIFENAKNLVQNTIIKIA